MKLSDLSLYIKRKMGFGMPLSYKLRVLSPAVLIVLVSLVLNFSLIFIISMSQGIENLLIYLGSGNIMVMGKMEEGEAFSTYETRYSGSLAFSESSSSPMYLKGVDFSSYFTKERRDVLHLEYEAFDALNPVILSKELSSRLSLDISDRFSVLIYDDNAKRTRPLLLTVAGTYDSGYMEFDSTLAFVPLSTLDGAICTELVTNRGYDDEAILIALRENGYDAYSYKSLYSAIYDNIELSVNTLYGVFVILVILASFFAGNISISYIDRDMGDIAMLSLSGLSDGQIRKVYRVITLSSVFISILIGFILAISLSFLSPAIISYLSDAGYEALDAYLTSFEIVIPAFRLFAVNLLLIVLSYISLLISLRVIGRRTIITRLSTE